MKTSVPLDIRRLNAALILDAALMYAEMGWKIFPVSGKQPCCEHGLLDGTDDDVQIKAWWEEFPYAGIGVATGHASGIVVVDLDGPVAEESWARFCAEYSLDDNTLRSKTGRIDGGQHLFFAAPEQKTSNGLAALFGEKVDFRGDGGYVILPPSPHQSGNRYLWVTTGRGILPFPEAIVSRWEELQTIRRAPTPARPAGEALRPGDEFNAKVSWAEILEPFGWIATRELGDETYWRRPGKGGREASATENYAGSDLFYVFSSNADPFVSCQAYSKFAAYSLLHHHNDFRAAARALAEEGYGQRLAPSIPPVPVAQQQAPTQTKKADLLWGDDIKPSEPRMAWNGRLVLGSLNLIAGDGGLGKSTIAAHIAARWTDSFGLPDEEGQPIQRGKVVFASYEDPPEIIKARNDTLGMNGSCYAVIEPARDENGDPIPFGMFDLSQVRAWIEKDPSIRLLIIDPWTDYLADDDTKTAPTRKALGGLARLAEETGLTVIVLAHVNKSSDVIKAVDKVKGTRELTNRPRSVLFAFKDPDNPKSINLSHIKSNWSAKAPTLSYRWRQLDAGRGWFTNDNPFEWEEGTRPHVDPDDMGRVRRRGILDNVKDWLRQQLAEGPKPAKRMQALAAEEHFPPTTFEEGCYQVLVAFDKDGEEMWTLK